MVCSSQTASTFAWQLETAEDKALAQKAALSVVLSIAASDYTIPPSSVTVPDLFLISCIPDFLPFCL